MRVHEIDLYSSGQILAFIEYLKVVAEEKKNQEAMQAMYQGNVNAGQLNAASCVPTPEYLAKLRALMETNPAKEFA